MDYVATRLPTRLFCAQVSSQVANLWVITFIGDPCESLGDQVEEIERSLPVSAKRLKNNIATRRNRRWSGTSNNTKSESDRHE